MAKNNNMNYILMALAPMIAGMVVFTALSFTAVVDVSGPRLEEVMFQNFEPANGTRGPYFSGIYYVNATFENLIVQEGERSVKMTVTGENGGTIGIRAASTLGYLSLQNAQVISLWVYDTQGNNTIQLRLKDSDGDGGSGNDGYFMWSAASSIQNEWALITWDLRDYPDVPNLDLDRIASIELYEWNPGVYYFDNINFTRLG